MGLTGAASPTLMRRNAVHINNSLGTVAHDRALIEAPKTGRIAAAGPDMHGHASRAYRRSHQLENVVLLPPIESMTPDARARTAETAAANVLFVLRARVPLNQVPA